MSFSLNQLNILFYMILLKSWNTTCGASIYNNDYNNNFDMNIKNIKDYFDNYETHKKRDANEPISNDDSYFQNSKPKIYSTTSIPPTSTATFSHTIVDTFEAPIESTEAEDVIEHIIAILRSMRHHAIALIRNMNKLEMDILSSSPPSNLEVLCKNSPLALSDSVDGMEKIFYPDVLSQPPGYVIREWGAPIETDSIPETKQTNEFVSEAQEAVKSWKKQIETCKLILDNAVHNALQKANLKSDLTNGFQQVSTNSKKDQENVQEIGNSKIHKYHGIYDAFHVKENK